MLFQKLEPIQRDADRSSNVKLMKVLHQTRTSILVLFVSIVVLFIIYLSFIKLTPKQRWTENPVNLRDVFLRNNVGNGAEKKLLKRSKPDAQEEISETRRTKRSDSDETDADYYSTAESKANYIREMMLHAWENYERFAWGHNELSPITKQPNNPEIFGGQDGAILAVTIVDALDTLWIMGLMRQYEEGREYVRDYFDIRKVNSSVSVFEVNIRFLGGLLSAHALTRDPLYLDKAKEVGDTLLHAFSRNWTPMPTTSVVPSTGEAVDRGQVILAEVGSLHMEFLELSRETNNDTYLNMAARIRDHLDNMEKMDGLYGNTLVENGSKINWGVRFASLGAEGDSFYEYLLKTYIQTNREDVQAWRMYKEAMKAIERNMLQVSPGGLTYFADWKDGVLEKKMSHLACFIGGMFALQSKYEIDHRKKRKALKLAEDIANTCHEAYVRSASQIGPETFHFDDPQSEAMATHGSKNYLLRPEVIESFFYLWRLTKNEKYKEWVWDAARAINKYCRVKSGFSGLLDVYSPVKGGHDDVQQSFFLAETLKYMYLTFVDDSVLSLDEWVFNTEAHPLPILRQVRRYRALQKFLTDRATKH